MLGSMPLAPDLYEHALTAALAAELGEETSDVRELRAEQLAPVVARHLAAELQRALAALPAEARARARAAAPGAVRVLRVVGQY